MTKCPALIDCLPDILRGGVGASSVVRNGARSSGTTMKIMITPEIMIWMVSRILRSFENGGSSAYPTVVMVETT